MILAAGRGERMGSLTTHTPKPLLEVAGETLIGRQLRALADAGLHEVVINLAYRGEMIRQALGDGGQWGVNIRYSDEGPEPLETAGGIIHALPLLGTEPFVLVSSDVVHDLDLNVLRSSEGTLGCLVMVPNPSHHPDGDFGLNDHGRITHVPPRLTFSGMAVLDPALFEGFEPGVRPLREILRPAIARNELAGIFHGGLWMDVGTPHRLQAATATLSRLG
jgi:MurNAc alpha-1-phosphate uridylyltransferase